MTLFYLLAIAAVLPCLLCQSRVEDPLCKDKVCPSGNICRHFKPCGPTENCAIIAVCTTTRPTRGGCKFGDPVLHSNNGTEEELGCYTSAPCPSNGYCSTLLQDVASVCCLSDPAKTENTASVCPSFEPDPQRFWCVDECKSDGDCNSYSKCCYTGCSRECVVTRPRQLPSVPKPQTLSPIPPLPALPTLESNQEVRSGSGVNIVSDDPCANLTCPRGQSCRHYKPCGLKEKCDIIGVCTATKEGRGGCEHGSPVLYNNNGTQKMLRCYLEAPCPSNAYCSTVLRDTSSRCCLADPAKTVKAEVCPNKRYNTNPRFCYDECKYDGDCRGNAKCCNTGCKKECVRPEFTPPPPQKRRKSNDPCNNKVCPRGQGCRHYKPCGVKEKCDIIGVCRVRKPRTLPPIPPLPTLPTLESNQEVRSGSGVNIASDDPCANLTCPWGQSCRHYKPCGLKEKCDIIGICTATRPTRGGCKFGDPVLHSNNGTEEELGCYTSAPCPSNGYCSTLLQDVASVCCLSDPAKTENAASVCPSFQPDPQRFWCVDECKSDGDCNSYSKCCYTGCSRECVVTRPRQLSSVPKPQTRSPIPPLPTLPTSGVNIASDDPCANLTCPRGQSCRHYKPCGLKEKCDIIGICTATRPTRGGCKFGDPVLHSNNGREEELGCYTSAPCPSNGYCSTLLQDVASVCCLSDPAKTENAASVCPSFEPDPQRFWCVDECKSDGDCNSYSKCCYTGCSRECVVTRPRQLPSVPKPQTLPPMPPLPTLLTLENNQEVRSGSGVNIVSDDPCANLACPWGQLCRHYKPCGLKEKCDIIGVCTATKEGRGGCEHSSPVLYNNNGAQKMLPCYLEAPCPGNAYCSTVLRDASSRCCLADPAKTVKAGVCPNKHYNTNHRFCYDECKYDGDCSWDAKCCNTGCKKECVRPEFTLPPTPISTQSTDPCNNKVCPRGQSCRHYKPCGLKEKCDIIGICTATKEGHGGCEHGSPVLYNNNGAQKMLLCYLEAPCPSNAYCSTVMMDTSSRCCLADPAKTVKAGVCPNKRYNTNRYFCYDECKYDGDCSWDAKCCNTGCKKECVNPEFTLPPTPISTKTNDPCNNKVCPRGQLCRHYKPCGLKEKCDIIGICTATKEGRGGCEHGSPVLYNNNGAQEMLPCYLEAPCPGNAYCSTVMMDTSSRCCLADPAKTVKAGVCPNKRYNTNRYFCYDECKYDGDCSWDAKCCNTGCKKECVNPEFTPPPTPISTKTNDPCNNKVCPRGQLCRHYKPCGLKEKCDIIGICTATKEGHGGCEHGSPVLYNNNGAQKMLLCYLEAPCPSNAYCSTVMMDTSSRCCLADPAKTVKAGVCPNKRYNTNRYFCYDECKYDGDCSWDAKCCNTGCKKECVNPEFTLPPTPISTKSNDPCNNKVCPRGQLCRHYKPCGLKEKCDIIGICTATKEGRGGCEHGSPVLYNNNGAQEMLPCYMEAPCPGNAYCSTVMMDTSSRCCLADPAKTVKAGVCPNKRYNTHHRFCYDECKYDGDCSWDAKCCNTGCKKECVNPEFTPPPTPQAPQISTQAPQTYDPCDYKVCPFNSYCRKRGQQCFEWWTCRKEGSCIPCPALRIYGKTYPDGCGEDLNWPFHTPRRPTRRAPVWNPFLLHWMAENLNK